MNKEFDENATRAEQFDAAVQRLVGYARQEGMDDGTIVALLKEAVVALEEGLT